MDWIINRYFTKETNKTFGKVFPLIKLSDTPILNYIKVKKGVRVYCKTDVDYWQKRDERAMNQQLLKHRRHLYTKQKGKCSECDYPLLPKAFGGNDSYSNLQLLHAECHREIHSKIAGSLDTRRTSYSAAWV